MPCLIALLSDQPGTELVSDSASADLIEEIIYHSIESAAHPEQAWQLYWTRLGSFANFEGGLVSITAGLRICRSFSRGGLPHIQDPPE